MPSARGSGDAAFLTWQAALVWAVLNIARNLWHIVKTTVLLMVLAGFLGSLLIVAVPWDTLLSLLPKTESVTPTMLLAMAALAVFGAFLPVPITFDVVIVVVLLSAGLPAGYAAVLLFTLGVFSVYSFQIVWRYMSKRVAASHSTRTSSGMVLQSNASIYRVYPTWRSSMSVSWISTTMDGSICSWPRTGRETALS